MCVWHDSVLLVCTKGIERDPCLGEWVGLGGEAHVALVCVSGGGWGGVGGERDRERESLATENRLSHLARHVRGPGSHADVMPKHCCTSALPAPA